MSLLNDLITENERIKTCRTVCVCRASSTMKSIWSCRIVEKPLKIFLWLYNRVVRHKKSDNKKAGKWNEKHTNDHHNEPVVARQSEWKRERQWQTNEWTRWRKLCKEGRKVYRESCWKEKRAAKRRGKKNEKNRNCLPFKWRVETQKSFFSFQLILIFVLCDEIHEFGCNSLDYENNFFIFAFSLEMGTVCVRFALVDSLCVCV